jgi:hypothetical protein
MLFLVRTSPLSPACLIAGLIALALHSAAASVAQETPYATGTVFHDRNGNGVRDEGEEGIAGILVSNQREIIATDDKGHWRLPVENEGTIFFVIKPTGWMPPLDRNNLPKFYYLHKPHGSPDLHYRGIAPTGPLPSSIDFPLHPREEAEEFEVIMAGDPQPRSLQEVVYLTRDILPELAGTSAAFGVSLGDIVSNNLDLFEPVNEAFGGAGIPWYNVIGNHDLNFDASDERFATETFHRVYGPDYYSFNYGNVHFLVLNNNRLIPMDGERYYNYDAGLGPHQMEFVRNNLALVPEEKLVVVMMHIPFLNHRWRAYQHEVAELFQLLGSRPHTLSLSGHTHTQHLRIIEQRHGWPRKEPHHNFVLATIGGSWWRGLPDEIGVPHAMMFDGTPRGYNLFRFGQNGQYSARFKATRRPADHQMNIWAPDVIAQDESGETDFYVNVFGGTPYSKVEMRIGMEGDWQSMEPTQEPDPIVVEAHQREAAAPLPPYLPMGDGVPSTHLWKATLPDYLPIGGQSIHVRTTDMFGQTFLGQRRVRVVLGTTPAHRAMFHPAEDGISFRFASEAGVDPQGIRLRVNGEDRSGDLSIEGTAQRFEARFDGLRANRLYQAEIAITERNGERVTRTLDFDTFDPENFTWEAVDYNFDRGRFIDNPPLDPTTRPNYRYKSGVQGIDKNEISRRGDRMYRIFDDVGTTALAGDLRLRWKEKNQRDYAVGWFAPGEWMNYTRTFPSGRFHVYGHFAYGRMDGFSAELHRVTSDPTLPDQSTARLGTFSKSTGTDAWDDFRYIPLRDQAGTLAVVELNGIHTLRLTASSVNVNFFILVPIDAE